MFRKLESCRLCFGSFYPDTYELEPTPAANGLLNTHEEATSCQRFPLNLVMCMDCKHVQLREIVSPEHLFGSYIYRSGASYFFITHFSELAAKLKKDKPDFKLALEVGSNDGTLMKSLVREGFTVVGIEPSKTLVEECKSGGLNVIQGFLDDSVFDSLISNYGKFDYIVGNNVFAHIDDLPKAFSLVSKLLSENGIFVFEVAHLEKILVDGIFDTIYHEHMSYHSALALNYYFNLNKELQIINIEKVSSHGGSLRFYLAKPDVYQINIQVANIIESEIKIGLGNSELISRIRSNTLGLREKVGQYIEGHIQENVDLIGYGAPAKVVTFLAEMKLEALPILGIIDDNMDKQGKYLPGSGFKISAYDDISKLLTSRRKIVCFIFPWNVSSEILNKIGKLLPKGTEVVRFFPTIKSELII